MRIKTINYLSEREEVQLSWDRWDNSLKAVAEICDGYFERFTLGRYLVEVVLYADSVHFDMYRMNKGIVWPLKASLSVNGLSVGKLDGEGQNLLNRFAKLYL